MRARTSPLLSPLPPPHPCSQQRGLLNVLPRRHPLTASSPHGQRNEQSGQGANARNWSKRGGIAHAADATRCSCVFTEPGAAQRKGPGQVGPRRTDTSWRRRRVRWRGRRRASEAGQSEGLATLHPRPCDNAARLANGPIHLRHRPRGWWRRRRRERGKGRRRWGAWRRRRGGRRRGRRRRRRWGGWGRGRGRRWRRRRRRGRRWGFRRSSAAVVPAAVPSDSHVGGDARRLTRARGSLKPGALPRQRRELHDWTGKTEQPVGARYEPTGCVKRKASRHVDRVGAQAQPRRAKAAGGTLDAADVPTSILNHLILQDCRSARREATGAAWVEGCGSARPWHYGGRRRREKGKEELLHSRERQEDIIMPL